MVNQIYPPELQLNKTYTSDTEAPCLDLHLFLTALFPPKCMINVMTDFDNVNFPVLEVVPLMECIFLNLFANLLEFVVM